MPYPLPPPPPNPLQYCRGLGGGIVEEIRTTLPTLFINEEGKRAAGTKFKYITIIRIYQTRL